VVHIAIAMNEPTEIRVVESLDDLFRLHYGRLVRALTVMSGDREQAADAVQEAFVKAHMRWRRLQHYDDPVGWIRRVAINRLRDGHRRSTRKNAALERLQGDVLDTQRDEVHDAASSRRGDAGGVMITLMHLPKQQRVCVALYYVDGMSVAEIAAALDLSEGAVKFHLHQGRERLRGHLLPQQQGQRHE
jgi:RNA polymerase sigma-70 factor (ECF subfamily)